MAIKRGVRAPGHISRRLTPSGGAPSTAGQPIGLLLLLTKAS